VTFFGVELGLKAGAAQGTTLAKRGASKKSNTLRQGAGGKERRASPDR